MKTFFLITALSLGLGFSTSADLDRVTFTLRNGSTSSIPLKIPGVMNPNLSPMSNSGVSLEVGQKIYFQAKGKKRLLLEVDPSMEGKTILVNRLIKERQRELGIKWDTMI